MATDSRGSDTTGWFISCDVTWMDIINVSVAHDIFSRKLWFTENIVRTTATFEFIKNIVKDESNWGGSTLFFCRCFGILNFTLTVQIEF